ncbi:MAG: hypothetical protein ACOCXH_11680 [Cyclobacteriaceae bacterium]
MLKKNLTYTAYFILFLAELELSYCSPSTASFESTKSFPWNKSKKNRNPKVIMLGPADYP